MTIGINGTEEHLEELMAELGKEGLYVRTPWGRVRHIMLWDFRGADDNESELVGYYSNDKHVTLNANLPSHRKNFIKRAKEVLL